jgi:hypothetical protein
MNRSASPREDCSVGPLPRRGTDGGGALLLGPSLAGARTPAGPGRAALHPPVDRTEHRGAAPVTQQLAEFVGRI